MATRPWIPVLLASLTATALASARPQAPELPVLDDVLDKVTDCVTVYTRDFVGIVAEETYRQEVRSRSSGNDLRGFPLEGQHLTRTLKSDMLLVRAPAGDRWLQFRDVFEVDGRPVRDREERLAKLFLAPSPSAQQQVEDIKAASARDNIGGVNRNINLPVLALSVFDLANRPWFTFTLGKKAERGTLELEYREQRSDTLIRGRGEQSTPATGKFLIERATGRILASELHADTDALKAPIDVVYDAEPAVGGMLVPREMREKRRDLEKLIALAFCLVVAAPSQPTLREVMERASRYVAEFEERLSGIVAEEQYVQEVRYPKRAPLIFDQHRELRSDLLLVRPVGGRDWLQFRDVFEVDKQAVRDRQERLTDIFLNPNETTNTQTTAILFESARYNIGALERTVNVPLLPLRFLEARHQSRFSFRRSRSTNPDAMTAEAPAPAGHFRIATEVWVVDFKERESPTMVRTRERVDSGRLRDLPARGRFWIEPATGRVLMSEMILEPSGARGVITVNYQSEPLLGLLVPVEMRERYDRLRDRSVIEGFASYGRFRQFQVKVDEKLGPLKK